LQGADMTMKVFDNSLPIGGSILAICITLFAFTTMLGWSYYGERCAQFLFGPKIVIPFRILWVIGIFLGTQMTLDMVWKMSDALNGLMAIPNLIALLLLSPVVFKLTRQYFIEDSQQIETIGEK